MKREIKFRVWDGEYIVLIADISNDTCLHFYEDSWTAMDHFTGKHIEICNNKTGVLMQYTGLKDKNGKDIYVGDIIRFIYDGKLFIESVHFGDASFLLGSVIDLRRTQIDEFSCVGKSMVIIGNIYENPELLGTKKDELSEPKSE